jgi:hypothetical protein
MSGAIALKYKFDSVKAPAPLEYLLCMGTRAHFGGGWVVAQSELHFGDEFH